MPVKEYELATGNILMGRFLWFIVRVPEGWAVKIGDSPSDVNYTTVVDNVAWVLDGSTAYFIVNLVNGMVYDLEVRVKKGIRTIDFNQFEMLTVNGHMAGLRRKEVRRGFRREPMKQLIVVIPCEKTLRTLELVLTGKDPEQLEKLKDTLSDSRCH